MLVAPLEAIPAAKDAERSQATRQPQFSAGIIGEGQPPVVPSLLFLGLPSYFFGLPLSHPVPTLSATLALPNSQLPRCSQLVA